MVNLLRYSLIPALCTLSTVLCLLTHLSSAQQETTITTSTSTTPAQKKFQIYHSLGQKKPFLPRGTITFSMDDSEGDNGNRSSNSNNDKGLLSIVVENDESCLGESAMEDMDELVSGDGFYRIKIVDEENGGQSVLASVPGCEVKRANFREEIALSMSQTGSLLSISYTPLVSPLAAQCHELQPLSASNRDYTFQTLISYTTSTPGMALPKILPKMRAPPGLQAIKYKRGSGNGNGNSGPNSNQPNENDNGGGGGGSFTAEEDEEKMKQEQNQSFFRKYWYIILPATFLTLMTGDDSQAPQRQKQSPGGPNTATGANIAGGGGGGANVAASTAASSNSTAARQRRGKRG